ncbi:MAG: hypothetical protein IJ161_07920 [Bacteroidales bacterium]|nr:hypothetical protein [Bacteroidales bacterium]
MLTEQEFREQKAQLLSQRAERNDGPDDGGFKRFVSSAKPSSPGSKKKNGSLLWIALGIVACIVIVVLAIAGSSHRTHNPDMPVIGADANQNGTVSGIRSNHYRDIDEYLLDKDNVYRDGTTVNYCDNEEAGDLGELIFGHLIRNPHTEIGKAISDMYRIEVLDTLLKKDPKLLHLISGNNLSLRYLWNGQEFYVFTPDEIKKKLQQY